MHFALYDFVASGEIAVGQLSWTEKFDLNRLEQYSRKDDHVVVWSDKKSRDYGRKFVVKVISVSENKAKLEEVAKLIEAEKLAVRNLPLSIVEPSVILTELGPKRQRVPKQPYIGELSNSDQESSGDDQSCGSKDAAAAPVVRAKKRTIKTKKSPAAAKKFAAAHSMSIMKDIITTEYLGFKESSDVEDGQSPPLQETQMVTQLPVTKGPCCCSASAEVLELKSALASLECTVKELLIPHIQQLATGLFNLEKSLLPQAACQLKHQAAGIPSSSRCVMPLSRRQVTNEGAIEDGITPNAVENDLVDPVNESSSPIEIESCLQSLQNEVVGDGALTPPVPDRTDRPNSPVFKQQHFERAAAHAVSSKASRFVAELMDGVFSESYMRSHCLGGTKKGSRSNEERRAPMRPEYLSFISRLAQEKIKPTPTQKDIMDAVRIKFNNSRRKWPSDNC